MRLLQELTEEPLEKIIRVFADEDGYQTPKVDIRAVLNLSTDRVTLSQLETIYELAVDPLSSALCD